MLSGPQVEGVRNSVCKAFIDLSMKVGKSVLHSHAATLVKRSP